MSRLLGEKEVGGSKEEENQHLTKRRESSPMRRSGGFRDVGVRLSEV